MSKKGKKTHPDISDLFYLASKTLTPEQRSEADKHIIERSASNYDGVDIQGKLSTVYAGIITATEDYKFQYKNYPFFRLFYTISGSATISDNKGEYISEAGSVCGFAPKELGEVCNNSKTLWKHLYVHFTGREASKMFERTEFRSNRVIQLTDPTEMQQLFENIVSEGLKRHDEYQTICDSYLRIILIKLAAQSLDGHEHTNTSRQSYLRCKNYIEENFSNILTITEVADACCINEVHLCRLFNEYSDISPKAYILKLKMNKAALLLIQTDYSIKQISFMLNYNSQYYFSKAFKKVYGISPTVYRSNHGF